MKNLKSLFIFFLLIIAVQFAGSLVTFPAVQGWYQTINKPSFNPPAWVFGPVWTTLYIMIAISGWMIWTRIGGSFSEKLRSLPIKYYGFQLFANLLWSFLFFGLENPMLGLVDICFLLVFIAANINHFTKIYKPAAYLLYPYFAWVSFATLLNASIVWLN